MDERSKGTSFGMTVAPEIQRSTVAVVADELAGADANRGEVVVVGGGGDKRGASSEEGNVEGPKVRKGRANQKRRVETHQGSVGIGPTMERSNEGVGEAANGVKNLFGDNKEQSVVGKEGNNESINKEDTIRDRELAYHGSASTNSR